MVVPINPQPLLELKNLKTQFGSKIIHRDLSLSVETGEILVLLGGSGAGKSVLLRTLIGLEIPSQGSCLFQGSDLFSLRESEWTKLRIQIAYAFQGGALFDSLTVGENLAYPMRAHTNWSNSKISEEIAKMLELISLPGTENLLPSALSGGMQKRVGLARAIALNPTLILYDEPTAGLDPANSRKISELMLELKKQGKTSILVTHDTECALHVANRIAFIHGGKIAALQSIAQFKSNPDPLIAAYFSGEDIS